MKVCNGIVDIAIQELIPASNSKARLGIKMIPQWITIHNTGNPGASAKANSNYVRNQNEFKSWHFTIDNKEIIQQLPITEPGWHAGDGSDGTGNLKSIGIEICEIDGAEDKAIKFVAELLKLLSMDVGKVVPHQHWSGKYCPRLILPHWDSFIDKIKKEMEMLKMPEEIKRYKNINEMPEWMRSYVMKWIVKGYIKGDGTDLNLSEDMIRVLIIAERMMDK